MSAALTALPLTAAQAREITDRIRGAAVTLHDLLLEAYARGAWSALGYSSWREYATAELSISQSRAYRLLDQAKVIAAIQEAAGGDISQVGKISAHAAADLKPVLPEVTEAVRERVAAGADPGDAVRGAVEEARQARKPEPRSAMFDLGPAAVEDDGEGAMEPAADEGPSLAEIAEEQERRIAELERENDSLCKGDLAAEVRRLSQVVAQMDGRLRQESAGKAAAEDQAKYLAGVLKKIRAELGVHQNQQILPAVRALMQGRSVA